MSTFQRNLRLDLLAAHFFDLLDREDLADLRLSSLENFIAEQEYLNVPLRRRAIPARRKMKGIVTMAELDVVLDAPRPQPQACCIGPRPRFMAPRGLHAHQDAAHLARTTLIHPEYPIHRA